MIILRQKTYASNTTRALALAGVLAAPIVGATLAKQLKKKREAREKAKAEQKKIDSEKFLREDLKKINPKLLIALDIENKVKSFEPSFGDGDEYPSFYVYTEYDDPEYFGRICLGFQNEEEYKWNQDKKYWEEVNTGRYPRRVSSIKQDIIKNLKAYKKEYQTADEDYGWTEEEVEEVERYLDKIIEEVQKSKL